MNAFVPVGSGRNHTSVPVGSRIIGPACPGPASGVTNTSPSVGSAAGVVTVTAGGSRSGREWKRITFVAVAGTRGLAGGVGSV